MRKNYPIDKIRSDFPILKRLVNNQPITYLDSASTTQKPNVVINTISDYYNSGYAAVHRGIYTISNEATQRIEDVRTQIANFINASYPEEIIFVKGTTEGINLVANSYGKKFLNSGDNILITEMEHHANIVPWQMLAKEKQLILRFIPLLPDGTLDISKIPFLVDNRTRLFALTQISNVLGTINPLIEIISKIRSYLENIVILIDGAQGIMHQQIDVKRLDCDFYVFSGHKIYGPEGIGVLYGKKQLLDIMPPWQVGGAMIKTVSLKKEPCFMEAPWRFEAGSINSAGIIGLGAAINYIEKLGIENIINYENSLMNYTKKSLKNIPNLIIMGQNNSVGIIAFNLHKYHYYDVGSLLDYYGIAIRTGHHCAMPLMEYFKVTGMCRASLGIYSTFEDIDRLVYGLTRIKYILDKKYT